LVLLHGACPCSHYNIFIVYVVSLITEILEEENTNKKHATALTKIDAALM
jgi:hypothetical protein